MQFSLPGLLGAAVGSAVGVIDFAVIAMLVRRAMERWPTVSPARFELVLKVLFVVNLCIFAGLGYWFGSTIGG